MSHPIPTHDKDNELPEDDFLDQNAPKELSLKFEVSRDPQGFFMQVTNESGAINRRYVFTDEQATTEKILEVIQELMV